MDGWMDGEDRKWLPPCLCLSQTPIANLSNTPLASSSSSSSLSSSDRKWLSPVYFVTNTHRPFHPNAYLSDKHLVCLCFCHFALRSISVSLSSLALSFEKLPEKLRRYAPTKENPIEPYLSINQHQSVLINIISIYRHQSALISSNQHKSASSMISQHQSASISISISTNQHL